jgi:hypothetical protein
MTLDRTSSSRDQMTQQVSRLDVMFAAAAIRSLAERHKTAQNLSQLSFALACVSECMVNPNAITQLH